MFYVINYNILFFKESIHNYCEVVVLDEKAIKITKRESLKGSDGYKTFSIRIKEDIVKELDEISSLTNRSRNELINVFLEYSVKNWELEEN